MLYQPTLVTIGKVNFNSMFKSLMTIVVILATPVATLAQPSVNQLREQAQQFTVLIQGPNSGSGVLIHWQGNNYWVLTTHHVVENFHPQEPHYIVTADQQRHSFNIENIKTLSDVDLAKIPFRSNKDYPVAPLANSDPQQEEPIFVSGFPLPSATINESQYVFREGQKSF